MPALLSYALLAAGIFAGLASFASSRARLLLFYALMFMTMGGVQLEVPLLGGGMRSLLALLLLIASRRTVASAVYWLKEARILNSAIALASYLAASNLLLSFAPSFKTQFENTGNFIFFLLCVAFMLSATPRQVIWLLVVMCLGLFSNILAYMPRWLPFMSGVTVFGPVPHYQEPAGSGLLLLPLLLMAIHQGRRAWIRLLALGTLGFVTVATFITGARTPMAAYMLVLMLYRRRLWWAVLVLLTGVFAFSLMPETTQTQRMIDRIQQLSVAARTGTLRENPDAGMRLENIRIALNGFSEKPVFGWGVGSWYAYRQQMTGIIGYELSAHSGWALLLFETGIVGTILYLFFISCCIRGLQKRFTDSLHENIGHAALLSIASILVVSLGGDTLLKRGSFTLFSLAAYSRCQGLRLRLSESDE